MEQIQKLLSDLLCFLRLLFLSWQGGIKEIPGLVEAMSVDTTGMEQERRGKECPWVSGTHGHLLFLYS